MNTLAIVGSRSYPNLEQVREFVRSLPDSTVVLSGGAAGVDHVAVKEAKACGLATVVIRPAYEMHGKEALLIRDKAIAEQCDSLVAFWDGTSTGTAHVMRCAKRLGKSVRALTPRDARP